MSSSKSHGGTGRRLPPSKTPEARRLARFLKDPQYGPKLGRLPKGEQRRLLDMVTGGQGRQARKDLLTTYDNRREARNARVRDLRLSKSVSEATSNLLRQLPEARAKDIRRNMRDATWQDRKFAKSATREELKERARQGPTTVNSDGKAINPFWYN